MKLVVIDRFAGEYRFLSNFSNATVKGYGKDDYPYPTVEHAFQAAKTTDPVWLRKIRNAPEPGDAKKLGRMLTLRSGWEEMKVAVMWFLIWQKFTPHHEQCTCLFHDGREERHAKLLATGSAELIEGNTWHDCWWGVCPCARCGNVGKNMLGKLLMRLRRNYRAAAYPATASKSSGFTLTVPTSTSNRALKLV